MPNSVDNMRVNFFGKSAPLSDLQNMIALSGSIFNRRFCFIVERSHSLTIPKTCEVDEISQSQQYLQYWSTMMNAIVAPLRVTMLCVPVQSDQTR